MKTLNKCNFKKHVYEPYNIPDDWKIALYEEDMDKIVNCANCGKEIKFGDCYTSRTIHADLGFGYAVCEDCHEIEFKLDRESRE